MQMYHSPNLFLLQLSNCQILYAWTEFLKEWIPGLPNTLPLWLHVEANNCCPFCRRCGYGHQEWFRLLVLGTNFSGFFLHTKHALAELAHINLSGFRHRTSRLDVSPTCSQVWFCRNFHSLHTTQFLIGFWTENILKKILQVQFCYCQSNII